MVLNSDQCFIMSLGIDDELQSDLVCGSEMLKNSKQEKVLGVTIDKRLNFATHILNITKNANIKSNTLIQKSLNTKQKKLIFSSLTRSQFANCLLIWMFCTKYCTSKTNKVGEDGCTFSNKLHL